MPTGHQDGITGGHYVEKLPVRNTRAVIRRCVCLRYLAERVRSAAKAELPASLGAVQIADRSHNTRRSSIRKGRRRGSLHEEVRLPSEEITEPNANRRITAVCTSVHCTPAFLCVPRTRSVPL